MVDELMAIVLMSVDAIGTNKPLTCEAERCLRKLLRS